MGRVGLRLGSRRSLYAAAMHGRARKVYQGCTVRQRVPGACLHVDSSFFSFFEGKNDIPRVWGSALPATVGRAGGNSGAKICQREATGNDQ